MAGADDTSVFPLAEEARILAQRAVKSKRTTVDFSGKVREEKVQDAM